MTEHEREIMKQHIQSHLLRFCTCGNPEEVFIYVRDFLQKLDSNNWGVTTDREYMFLCYWSNRESFATHGSNVAYSWLTLSGKALLNEINEYLKYGNTDSRSSDKNL